MADKNRNFRSTYYDKVGFRCVEEKKALENLINEVPMDKSKLSKFCFRCTLPSMYREYVWQVLLDVLSVYPETHKSIMQQRKDHVNELRLSLEVMHKINSHTPEPVVYVLMYLMSQEILLFDITQQLADSHAQILTAIASVFLTLNVSKTEQSSCYWMFRNFIMHQKKISICLKSLKEQLETVLKKEDEELHAHLRDVRALEILPINLWFQQYFAGIIYHSSLVRIWDKVIGGNNKILPYAGASILIVLRHPLLSLDAADEILKFVEKISEDTSDVIVNKALDLYYSL